MVMMMVEKEVAHLASENKKKKKNEGNMTTIFIFYGGK